MKPVLLFDQSRSGLGKPRGNRIVSRATKQRDGAVPIETTEFVASKAFEFRARVLPSLHPPATVGHLLGSPTGQI
jgi:hypothetical protein